MFRENHVKIKWRGRDEKAAINEKKKGFHPLISRTENFPRALIFFIDLFSVTTIHSEFWVCFRSRLRAANEWSSVAINNVP